MREIKFRAWHTINKQMAPSSCSWGGNVVLRLEPYTFIAMPSDAVVLMQYTGLKDKNGKDIYEGDIIQVNGAHKYEIFYEPAQFYGKNNYTQGIEATSDCEVIGNKFQNPELLQSK